MKTKVLYFLAGVLTLCCIAADNNVKEETIPDGCLRLDRGQLQFYDNGISGNGISIGKGWHCADEWLKKQVLKYIERSVCKHDELEFKYIAWGNTYTTSNKRAIYYKCVKCGEEVTKLLDGLSLKEREALKLLKLIGDGE